MSPQCSKTLTALKEKYGSREKAAEAGWRFVDEEGTPAGPGKMSGPHFFLPPGRDGHPETSVSALSYIK